MKHFKVKYQIFFNPPPPSKLIIQEKGEMSLIFQGRVH